MAAPAWNTDALGTALSLLGKRAFTKDRLNTKSIRDNRIALSTTVNENLTATDTAITVTSAAGFPAVYPFFARIVYAPATPAHQHWAADTVTTLGTVVVPTTPADGDGGWQYAATVRNTDYKTHATTEPTWPTVAGDTVVDDAVTWTAYPTGDEIVKVTNIVGNDLTVTRKARSLPHAYSGTLVTTPAVSRVFKTGSAIHVLGRSISLTAASAIAAVALTTSLAADDIIDTTEDHGLAENQRVYFATLTGGTGLVANRVYWVSGTSLAAKTFRVAASKGGTPLGFSTNITAGSVQPLGTISDADAATLGSMLNMYLGLSKVYGKRVYEVASRAKRILTLTVVE